MRNPFNIKSGKLGHHTLLQQLTELFSANIWITVR